MTDAALRCRGLTKRFGTLTALDGLDLEVAAGDVFAFLGPNGAGKSTTIRLLLGLSKPSAGQVALWGDDPADREIRRRVGYLPGELRLDDKATGRQLLDHWARLRGGIDPAYQTSLVDRLGLDPNRPVRELSTGNRRKVGLVGAFMPRPDLLVLDEPTKGLDPLVQAEFLEMVREVNAQGTTVFLSSHDLAEVQRVADRAAVLRRGRLVAEDSIETLRHATRQRFEAYFDEPVPADELAACAGVANLVVEGDRAQWTVTEGLQAVLAVLGAHPVRTLIAPEPDLEDAFFALYHQEGQP